MRVNRLPATVRQLVEAAASVAGQADLADVLRTTVRTAMELTDAAYGALGVMGPHGILSDFIFEGLDPEAADAVGPIPMGRGVLGAIRDHPLRVDDISGHPEAVGFPPNHPRMSSFLGVPVRLGTTTHGNLYLTNKASGTFTAEDEVLVGSLAVIAGSAISRARLERRLEHAALVEDRERIARDIHDGVIQELFAVGLALQAARRADASSVADRIDEAMSSIDHAMTGLREYIFDLQSQAPDFEARLRSIVSHAATDIELRVELDGELGDLARPVTENLTQFVREAISNAIRHSGASLITVRAMREDGLLTVEVEDDGTGFDTSVALEGLGLANMRERMSTIGGTCQIRSDESRGTVASGSLPL